MYLIVLVLNIIWRIMLAMYTDEEEGEADKERLFLLLSINLS